MLSIKVTIHEVPNCAKQFYILPILNVYKQKTSLVDGVTKYFKANNFKQMELEVFLRHNHPDHV
jgi:hypothetical protein